MFSVVIPLYNKQNYVLKAIKSVLSQTFNVYEIIIVNDGSTDKSLYIVDEFIEKLNTECGFDNQIRIITQENQGVSAARNKGVEHAQFDFIAFLDADDTWEIRYLEEMKKLIEEYSKAILWSSNYFIIKNKTKRVAPVLVDTTHVKAILDYYTVYAKNLCMPVWTGATIIKKTTFEELKGFNTDLKFGEDFDLWLRASFMGNFVFLNMPLSNYNQDVDVQSRAIGGDKIYKKEQHYLFNLNKYEVEEKANQNLKVLLDRMRVSASLRYYLKGYYNNEITQILAEVNWENISCYFKKIYHLPRILIILYFKILLLLSSIKQQLIRWIN